MNTIKKHLNIHITKLHFYLLSSEVYKTVHTYIRDNITIDSLPLHTMVYNLHSIIFFGYIKNKRYRYLTQKETQDPRLCWTKEDIISFDAFTSRHAKKSILFIKIVHIFLYHLHMILLLCFCGYDIYNCYYILTTTAKILPFLFLYQLYILLCYFIRDKYIYDINELTNILYYKNISVEETLTKMPENFVQRFLEYESSSFSRKNKHK